MLGYRLVEEEDAQVVQVESDAHARVLLHTFPERGHVPRIVDAFDDEQRAFGGAGGADAKHVFHEGGVPIVVQVEETDRHAGFEKEFGEVGGAYVVGMFAGGFQVKRRCCQTAGIDHGCGLGIIDKPEQKALHAQGFVQPFRIAGVLHLLFERAQLGILVVGRTLVDNAGDEVEGKG